MSTLASVFAVLNELHAERVLESYAVGGAMAVLFYAEPARTYDVEVFVLLPGSPEGLVDLSQLYSWLRDRGFAPDAEHVLIHDVPVQFLPAYNPVRVVSPEHLFALALQAGGSRRRERAAQLLESGAVDRAVLLPLLERHGLDAGGLLDG